MTQYDEELRQLQQQIARQQKLESILADLRRQQRELSLQEAKASFALEREEADVLELEKTTMATLFYTLFGKMEGKLEKERQEALAAAVKHDAAARQLAALVEEIRPLKEELDSLDGCRKRYQKVLEQKAEALKAQDPATAVEIMALETQIGATEAQLQEVREAQQAGNAALSLAISIRDEMHRAENWSTVDLMSNSMLADIAKYSHINTAQEQVDELQSRLRRFRAELGDIDPLRADPTIEINGFLHFADYFFDGVLFDWAVAKRIVRSIYVLDDLIGQLNRALNLLKTMIQDGEEAIDKAEGKREKLVLASPLPAPDIAGQAGPPR